VRWPPKDGQPALTWLMLLNDRVITIASTISQPTALST
jgi:hypothetical protein